MTVQAAADEVDRLRRVAARASLVLAGIGAFLRDDAAATGDPATAVLLEANADEVLRVSDALRLALRRPDLN